MDRLTVVGGLAPYLLVPPQTLPEGVQHVGTLDLDLGLALAGIHDPSLYDRITETLLKTGFAVEKDREGRKTLRWRWPASGMPRVWIDFIPDADIGGEVPWLPDLRSLP
jgi:hypothetical protein